MPTMRERVGGWLGLPSPQQVTELEGQVSHLLEDKRRRRMAPVSSGVETNYGAYLYEKNVKLRGDSRWDEYDGMLADPHIKSSVRGFTHALGKADWEIKAASEEPRDVEIAEFVAANLLRQGGDKYGREYFCGSAWKTQRLPEILAMLEHGFSMFAKSTKVVGGKLVYDRLQWLEPSSVDPQGWEVDDQDFIVRVLRTYSIGTAFKSKHRDPLEAYQIALYPYDFRGARYEGTPFIRCMWGAWVRKSFVQRMESIWAQKAGAPAPWGCVPPNYTAEEFQRFKEFIESNRGTAAAENHFVGRLGPDGTPPVVSYAGAESDLDRGFSSILQTENAELAHGGGSKHMQLGETSSGSRSLGDSQGLAEFAGVEAVADLVCEWETHGVGNLRGLIEELVDWNFAGVTKYPEMVCSNVNPFEMRNSLDAKIEAWKAGIIPHHEDARRQIVESDLGLNLPDEVYEVEEPVVPSPFVDPSQPGPPGTDSPPNTDADEGVGGNSQAQMGLESAAAFRARIAPMLEPMEDAPTGGNFRGRTRLEAEVVNMAAVQTSFRVGERDFLIELRAGHRAMIEDLMGRFRAGKITVDTLTSQRRSNFKGARRVTNRVVKVARRVGAEGWGAVMDEIGRQRAT